MIYLLIFVATEASEAQNFDCTRDSKKWSHTWTLGGRTCCEYNYGDGKKTWKSLREDLFEVTDDMLADVDFGGGPAAEGKGGKNGDIRFTKDKKFTVKKLAGKSSTNWGDDYNTLSDYAFFEKYYTYMSQPGKDGKPHHQSFLTRFISMCKTSKKERWIVMASAIRPNVFPDSPSRTFDLKGTTEERTFVAGEGKSANFSVNDLPWGGGKPGKDGNFWREAVYLADGQTADGTDGTKTGLMKQFGEDIRFLQESELMDYSFLVNVETMSLCDAQTKIMTTTQPSSPTAKTASSLLKHNGFILSVRHGVVYAYSFGLIDILQRWVLFKEFAQVAKYMKGHSETARDTVPPEPYGGRMLQYLQNRIFLSKHDFMKSDKAKKLLGTKLYPETDVPATLDFPKDPKILGNMCQKFDWSSGIPLKRPGSLLERDESGPGDVEMTTVAARKLGASVNDRGGLSVTTRQEADLDAGAVLQ